MPRITLEPKSGWVEITTAECLFEVQYHRPGIGTNPDIQVMFSAVAPTDVWFTLPPFSMRQYVPNADSLYINNKSTIPVSVVYQEL
jgi:hypothetical protein